jgi:hypothetical protein
MKRPNPLLWCWYAVGGRLPAQYREWVLHDATTRTWLLRYAIRNLIFYQLPVLALLFVIFGVLLTTTEPLIVLLAMVLGLFAGTYFSLAYSVSRVDNRVAQHGYPRNHASAVRRAAQAGARRLESERYNATWRSPGS